MDDQQLEGLAAAAEGEFARRRRQVTDFRFDETQEKYWDITTGNLLGSKAVDGAIAVDDWPTRIDGRSGEMRPFPPSKAINAIDTGLTVEGATWWPGKPQFIEDHVVTERGTLKVKGAVTYNSYIAPCRKSLRTDRKPDRWITHVKFLFPDPVEHEHFFDFAAHCIQRPDEKLNHGMVIAGPQGIGKDTALVPLRKGVGDWNAAEIGPDDVTRQYNGFLKSVLLVVNEVRPHEHDTKASNFYNLLKPLLAAPPEMAAMNLKYANTIYVRNLCHVILTTNDPLTMYIPSEDRRLFVMTSLLPDPKSKAGKALFSASYFDDMYDWLEDGGSDSVVRWLDKRDILSLNAGAPPPMTAGKRAIIDSASQVRRTMADDVIDEYIAAKTIDGKPPQVIFSYDLDAFVDGSDLFDDKLDAIKCLRAKNMHFKMDERGYELMRNEGDQRWKHTVFRSRSAYVRREVPEASRLKLIDREMKSRADEIKAKKDGAAPK